VIVSLALFFAGPVLSPAGRLDAGAVALLLACLGLLLWRRWTVLPLIGVAGLIGLLRGALIAAGVQ